jgi:hypothetical protein
MPTFVTVTRKDTGTPQVVNLDSVEQVDVIAAETLPPLDSPLPITSAHVGSSVLHFSSGSPPMAIAETGEDLASLTGAHAQSADATKALADARKKKIADIVAKRLSERQAAAAAALKEKHDAELAKQAAEVAAAAPVAPVEPVPASPQPLPYGANAPGAASN